MSIRKMLLIGIVIMSWTSYAQRPITQCGRVRSICYNRLDKPRPIGNVWVKPSMQPGKTTDANGDFCISVVPDKNNTYKYESIKLIGYTLISPSQDDLSKSSFVASDKEKKEIIMVKDADFYAERRRISNNIRKEKEKEIGKLQMLLSEKEKLLNQYKEQNKETSKVKADLAELERKYEQLQANYEQATKLIEDEADRLARIDYLNIDSINVHSYDLQKAGLWQEAAQYNKSFVSNNGMLHTAHVYQQALKQRDFEAERCAHIADSYAQGYERDSAMYWLEQRVVLDPENVDYLYSAGRYSLYGMRDKKKSESFFQRAYECSIKQYGAINVKTSNCLTMLGNVYTNMFAESGRESDYETAVNYHKKAISSLNQEEDKDMYITCISNLGIIYLNKDYKEALACFRKSHEFHMQDTIKYRQQLASDYNNIGRAYTMLGKYEEAQKFLNEAIKIGESLRDIESLGIYYHNIGEAYYYDQKNYKAKESYIRSIEYWKKAKSKDIYHDYFMLGNTYYRLREWDNAIDSYNKCKQYTNSSTDEGLLRLLDADNNICTVLYEKKDYSTTISQCKETIMRLLTLKEIAPNINIAPNIKDINRLSYLYINITLNDLTMSYYYLGKSMEGIDFIDKVISMVKTSETLDVNKKSFEILGLLNMGALFYTEGDALKAKENYSKALLLIDTWSIDNQIKEITRKEINKCLKKISNI